MTARVLTSFCLVLGVLGASTVTAGPALADCIGPTIDYEPGEVTRGERITVTGEGFGDNCYDTGPPPEGQGVLGNPLTDIEVLFLQGTTEIVVARGAANADYEFDVTVTVPVELEAGEVTIEAGHELGESAFTHEEGRLTVVDEPASTPASGAVEPVIFGPEENPQSPGPSPEAATEAAPGVPAETPAEPGSGDTDGSESRTGLLRGGAVILALLIVALVVVLPRLRARRAA